MASAPPTRASNNPQRPPLTAVLPPATCAGLGAGVALALRCLGGRRQSVGELLLGVVAVQEVRLEAEEEE